eukprot:7498009-Pyramimonas_sp.AAC.1
MGAGETEGSLQSLSTGGTEATSLQSRLVVDTHLLLHTIQGPPSEARTRMRRCGTRRNVRRGPCGPGPGRSTTCTAVRCKGSRRQASEGAK